MNLTPIDVEQKAFTQALRGYQMDEVDDFLDEVVATLRQSEQRLREAQERIQALEAEVANRGTDESAISRAFLAAQRSADALISEAETQAEKIRADARAEAERLMGQRDRERASLQGEIDGMRAAVVALKAKLAELASSVGEGIEEMMESLDGASTEVAGDTPPRHQLEAETADEDSHPEEGEPEPTVASVVNEIPTLDLSEEEEAVSRVSARPWERG
jgi:cell division initiation protein